MNSADGLASIAKEGQRCAQSSLPLACLVPVEGFEPVTGQGLSLLPLPLGYTGTIVRPRGFEPPRGQAPPGFEPSASTSSSHGRVVFCSVRSRGFEPPREFIPTRF